MRLPAATIAGLLDELEKISKKKDEVSPDIAVGERVLGAGTGLLGVAIPAGLVGTGLGMATAVPSSQPATAADVSKLRQAMDMPDPVQLERSRLLSLQHGGGVNAMPVTEADRAALKLSPGQHSRSLVDPATGVGTLAHEMGHGSVVRNPVGRLVRTIAGPARAVGALGGLGMAVAGDPEGEAAKYAPLVGAAGALPTIGEEAVADIKGLIGQHRAGYGAGRILRSAGRRALGFGSYLVGLGAPLVAAPYAVVKARKYWRKRLQEERGQEAE